MPVQIIKDMTNEDYHAHPALSKSSLDEFNKSPYHYWLKYLSGEAPPVKWTDAFTIGSALHALVLEPQNFERDFAVKDKVDARTKAGKEYNASFAELAEGKIVIDEDQVALCEKLVNSIQNHPLSDEYLDGFGEAEVSMFWEQEGVECRCRPDYIRPDGLIVDVKTAQSANPNAFQNKAFDFRYHVQAAFYSMGFEACYGEKPKGFAFVVVEKTSPYCVTIADSTEEFLDAGRVDAITNLKAFRESQESNYWPSYNQDKVFQLGVPSYKKKLCEEAA